MAGLLSAVSVRRYGAWARLRNRAGALVAAVVLALPAQAGVTIAALGDSLTQGYGLPQEDGFVPQLQAWLRAQGADATVLNAGVSGDTTAGGLSRVGWTLSGDVDAMIVALGGNDLLRGIDPAVSRANLARIIEAAQAQGVRVLLVGLPAPGNYGPDYKQAFDMIFPDLAQHYGTLHYENFLQGVMDTADSAGGMAGLMQPDGIHPSAQGVEKIVAAMGPTVLALVRATE